MPAPISEQLDSLGRSIIALDASISHDGQIRSFEFLEAVDSLLVVFGTHLQSLNP